MWHLIDCDAAEMQLGFSRRVDLPGTITNVKTREYRIFLKYLPGTL